MAVGGLNDYLPFLLREISSQPRRQYLLLHSLKDVIRWLFERPFLFSSHLSEVTVFNKAARLNVALWRPHVAIKE